MAYGNDYIFIDNLNNKIANNIDYSKLAIKISNRNFGVGADGLVIINKDEKADCYMKMYNNDGSEGNMCGNAIRCISKYVYETYKKDNNINQVLINTKSGIKVTRVYLEDGCVKNVKVNMGVPVFDICKIPVKLDSVEEVLNNEINIDGHKFNMTCVSMGNPHAVCVLDNNIKLESLDIEKIGKKIQSLAIFPNSVNVEFVKILDKKTVKMYVYERGTGRTLACGTGACATVAGLIKNNYLNYDEDIEVILEGGILNIKCESATNNIYMTGTAEINFKGEYEYE